MLIGVSRLRTWASLLMLASMDDKPRELMVTGIVRAKMCEELAAANGFSTSERFFTVGLFSVLDAMLDTRMEDILEKLPLSEEISQALITHEELLGNMLDFTIAYEQGDWERLAEVGSALKLDPPANTQRLHECRQVDDGNHERTEYLIAARTSSFLRRNTQNFQHEGHEASEPSPRSISHLDRTTLPDETQTCSGRSIGHPDRAASPPAVS